MVAAANSGLWTALMATGRSPEIPESADAYGWLIGSWELECLHYAGASIPAPGISGEIHFAWVLEGRAVQDVWIMPRRAERSAGLTQANNMYGTTLRVWDASIQAYRISWKNSVSGHREEQIGRRNGDEIVQLGARQDGTLTRWRFTEITADSFHWLGEALQPDGTTWRLEGEFRARRVRSKPRCAHFRGLKDRRALNPAIFNRSGGGLPRPEGLVAETNR